MPFCNRCGEKIAIGNLFCRKCLMVRYHQAKRGQKRRHRASIRINDTERIFLQSRPEGITKYLRAKIHEDLQKMIKEVV